MPMRTIPRAASTVRPAASASQRIERLSTPDAVSWAWPASSTSTDCRSRTNESSGSSVREIAARSALGAPGAATPDARTPLLVVATKRFQAGRIRLDRRELVTVVAGVQLLDPGDRGLDVGHDEPVQLGAAHRGVLGRAGQRDLDRGEVGPAELDGQVARGLLGQERVGVDQRVRVLHPSEAVDGDDDRPAEGGEQDDQRSEEARAEAEGREAHLRCIGNRGRRVDDAFSAVVYRI